MLLQDSDIKQIEELQVYINNENKTQKKKMILQKKIIFDRYSNQSPNKIMLTEANFRTNYYLRK